MDEHLCMCEHARLHGGVCAWVHKRVCTAGLCAHHLSVWWQADAQLYPSAEVGVPQTAGTVVADWEAAMEAARAAAHGQAAPGQNAAGETPQDTHCPCMHLGCTRTCMMCMLQVHVYSWIVGRSMGMCVCARANWSCPHEPSHLLLSTA